LAGLQSEIYRNSILAIDAEGSVVAHYAKHHLVPFGEYVPWWSPLQVEQLTGGSGYFTPGSGPLTIQMPGSRKVGMSILRVSTNARSGGRSTVGPCG